MEKVFTKDGSVTLRSAKFGQWYHSLSGAKEEATDKYVKPARISERKSCRLLDFCFGLGYNTAAAIDALSKEACLDVVAIEYDQKLLDGVKELEYPFECRQMIVDLIESNECVSGGVKMKLFVEDARDAMKKIEGPFDVVFFDPFSIGVCPELWTEEVFKSVYDTMAVGGELFTYSCARKVRDAMRAVGFEVSDGPHVGRRGPSTIGTRIK
jgi:predicted methyltransferase